MIQLKLTSTTARDGFPGAQFLMWSGVLVVIVRKAKGPNHSSDACLVSEII
jgi:hypothetical protein